MSSHLLRSSHPDPRMILFRLLGRIFLLIAFAVVALGVLGWLAGHDVTKSAGELWYLLEPGSLNVSQAIVQRYLHPSIWEALAVPLLVRPFWEAMVLSFIFLLVLGSGLLFLASRRRRPRSSERS